MGSYQRVIDQMRHIIDRDIPKAENGRRVRNVMVCERCTGMNAAARDVTSAK